MFFDSLFIAAEVDPLAPVQTGNRRKNSQKTFALLPEVTIGALQRTHRCCLISLAHSHKSATFVRNAAHKL